jgi:Alginate export
MRLALLICVPIVLPALVAAQQLTPGAELPLTPPGYKMLRFDEDYSYLTNQAKRTDLFDPVKYILLRQDDPLWYLTFGGELRERYEGHYEPNFGIGGEGSDSYLLQRVTLLTDVHLGERLRVFAEGISGVIEGESQPAPPVQDDPIDLQFAFVDVVPWLKDDASLTLRVGRFGMSFGAGRLVATRAAPNIPNRFEGLEMFYSRPGWDVTGFLTQPVEDSGGISGADHSTTFWGLYATHYFDVPRTIGLDLYYLGIHNEQATYASGTGDEHRHTLGAREFGARNQWDWDAEQMFQVGSFGNDSILAWAAAVNAGYTWDTKWSPRLGLKTGATSGDNNPNDGRLGTFDALFFKSGYFNDASLIRPQNIISVHPNFTVRPLPKVTIDGGVSPFWRYSRNDAVYAVPGFVEIPALQNASSYIGTAFDINVSWQLQRHVSVQASYVHFLTGSYVHQAGGSDVDYFSTTITFLF